MACGSIRFNGSGITQLSFAVTQVGGAGVGDALSFAWSFQDAQISLPRITLQKALGGTGRVAANDQFTLSASGAGAPAAVNTTGAGTAVSSPAYSFQATPGSAYVLNEAMAAGSTSTLAKYTQSVTCSNVGGPTNVSSLTSLPINITPAIGDAISCVVTNTPAATLQLAKSWGPNSITGNVASIGASTGGASNTTAFTATAPTAGNSGPGVTVRAGNAITLPAETMSSGTLANYATALSCTADGGAMASTLSGTNGQVSNTLTIAAGDIGKAIVCTYTNTMEVAPTVLLGKAPGAGPVADTTFNFTLTGLSRTAAALTTTHLASVHDPQGNSTGSIGVPVTITEVGIPSGWSDYISSLGCTDSNSAASGNPASFAGTVSGNVATIPAEYMRAKAILTCTVQNRRPSVQIRKVVVGTAPDGGKFDLTVSGGRPQTEFLTNPAIDVSSGDSGDRVGVDAGSTVTISETAGTLTSLSNYTSTASCARGVTVTPVPGTPGAFTLTAPSASAPQSERDVNCTITNTPKTATLQVRKAWGANSETGNVASIGATTGGTNNTALFTATAPTAGNSGTAAVATVGNTITFPAETMPTGTLANYTTVLSCTADGGPTANALSGTNGQASNTLVIGAGDAGKAIVCTYSNNRLPTVQIRKQALGGTGTFAFSGTNGFGADSINVSVSGSTVVGTIKTLTTANTQTVLTEVAASMPGGFAFSGATCTGLAGGATAAVDLVAGTVTLPAAGLTNGTAVVCTFTNTLAAIVSGRVFLDNGIGSGTANDGIVNGGEGPLSGVSVRLTNCGATVYASALTDASGGYSLSVPAGTATGSAMCVEETNPGTRVSTGASVGNVALPSGSAVAAAGGTYTYTRTGTPDRIAFSWNGAGHSNLNFGDVDNSAFATDGAKTGLPGSTVTYAHTFTAGTAGQVRFSVASETATPPITGWTTKIFADVGCTGSLQAGAAQLYPPSAAATPVVFAGKVCVIVQEFIPATAPLGSSNKATIRADFSYTNANPSLSGSFTLDDLTTVSGVALELKKEVRNITQSGTFGVNNQAKSGETLEYRITYTNNGDAPIRSMVVNDMTPGYTTFVSATTGTTPASLTGCVKNTPANAPPVGAVACTTVQPAGGTGAIDWRFTGTVEPGGTGFVLFQVKVD